jgi:hypothetical protein
MTALRRRYCGSDEPTMRTILGVEAALFISGSVSDAGFELMMDFPSCGEGRKMPSKFDGFVGVPRHP